MKEYGIADHSLIHDRMHNKTIHEDLHNKNLHSDMHFGINHNDSNRCGHNFNKNKI